VTALGRIEPRDGIIRVAGPARPTVVIAKLFVDEGDRVKLDQPLAELDSLAEDQARVAKAKAASRMPKRSWRASCRCCPAPDRRPGAR